MKVLSGLLICILIQVSAFSQSLIEGDRLLELIGKPVADPLFQQLKKQETFFTDAWDEDFTIYISTTNNQIKEIELQNGKLRFGSTTTRYGYYNRSLPLQLNWTMSPDDFARVLGKPVIVSTAMSFSDYNSGQWKIRIFFENNKPVSVNYAKRVTGVSEPTTPAVAKPVTTQTQPITPVAADWVIKVDTNTMITTVNWPALRSLIISTANLRSFTSKDSVDYIGQMYYGTPYKAIGFERTAIKKKKKEERWHYEAFLKMAVDTNKVKSVFFSLYDAVKKAMKENTGDDFILASVAKDAISHSPVNWLAQWTIYSGYKGLVPGLDKVKVALMVSGMQNAFRQNRMEYTFKFYVFDKDTKVDFFTWNEPM
jgi:hypothetical protein